MTNGLAWTWRAFGARQRNKDLQTKINNNLMGAHFPRAVDHILCSTRHGETHSSNSKEKNEVEERYTSLLGISAAAAANGRLWIGVRGK